MERFFFKGLPVSNGVGMGNICIFQYENYKINTELIEASQVEFQFKKLEQAIAKTIREIYSLKNELKSSLEKDGNLILEVYKAILEDDFFIREIKTEIKENRLHAENAVDVCFNSSFKEILESNNEYAKQRVYDLNDIRSRLVKNIIGASEPVLEKIYHKHIVAVKELTPTLAVALGKKKVMGIIADEGAAFFSHAAIILRGLGIPTLNDVNFINIKKCKDNYAIIDGQDGILIVNPENAEINRYRGALKNNIQRQKELIKKKKKPTFTRDGFRIYVLGNIGNLHECISAKDKSVDGIGLVRTEILFVDYSAMPDEKEQFLAYSKIIKKMQRKPVVFRTADFGGDKTPDYLEDKSNPLDVDLRGIGRSLLYKDDFIIQIRSILRVARLGDVSISFPMVNNAMQIKEAKSIVRRLVTENYPSGEKAVRGLKIGAVIETREGIAHLDEILKEVDFISIGSNDLFQQIKGQERDNNILMEREYLDPGFLKIVYRCIEKVNKKGKQAVMCGEMAADPVACVLLIGMGLSFLSMSPSKVVEIKALINKISLLEAKLLAKKIMRLHTAKDVIEVVSEWMLKSGSEQYV